MILHGLKEQPQAAYKVGNESGDDGYWLIQPSILFGSDSGIKT